LGKSNTLFVDVSNDPYSVVMFAAVPVLKFILGMSNYPPEKKERRIFILDVPNFGLFYSGDEDLSDAGYREYILIR